MQVMKVEKLISNQATFDKHEIPGKVLMLFRESMNFGKSNTKRGWEKLPDGVEGVIRRVNRFNS